MWHLKCFIIPVIIGATGVETKRHTHTHTKTCTRDIAHNKEIATT